MKRHMLSHSGAKPYSCDFCDKSYTDNYSLKQHVAKVHPGVASTIPNMMTTTNRTKKSGPNAREVKRGKTKLALILKFRNLKKASRAW